MKSKNTEGAVIMDTNHAIGEGAAVHHDGDEEQGCRRSHHNSNHQASRAGVAVHHDGDEEQEY